MTSNSIYTPITQIAVSGKQVGPGLPSPGDSPEERKLKKSAGDFESILLSSMWKGMKQSFGPSDTEDSDPAHGTLEDWGIEVMSGAVGKAGGLGIAKLILKHLEPQLNPALAPIAPESAQAMANPADVLRDR
jgi:Rod binding domain-containing protein